MSHSLCSSIWTEGSEHDFRQYKNMALYQQFRLVIARVIYLECFGTLSTSSVCTNKLLKTKVLGKIAEY